MVFLKRVLTFVIPFALIIASLASPVAALDPAMTDEQRAADWRRLDNGAKIAACLSRGIGGKGGGVPITTVEKADSKSFSAPDFFIPDTPDWACRATMPKVIRAFLDADPSTSGTSELDFFTGLGWELAEGKRYAYSRVRGESSQVEFIKKYKLPTVGGNTAVNTTPTSDMTRGKLIAEYQDLCQKTTKYGTRAEIEQSGSAEAKKELREFHDKSPELYMLATIGDDGAIVETLYRALPNTSTRYVQNKDSSSQYTAIKKETIDLAPKCVEAARAFSTNTKASVAALNKEAELKIAKEIDKDLGLCTNLNGAEKNACLASIGKAWTECNKPITTGSTTGATQARSVKSTATCLKTKLPAARNKIEATWITKMRGTAENLRGSTYAPSGSIDPPGSGEGGGEDDGPECALEGGVGWLVCPAMTLIAGLSDGAYGLISMMLDIEPMLLNTDARKNEGVATYTAWGVFRNMANVAFIIVFLIVIFSQVSNVGISNYGIKRIMPRLIIGAILINASFFISQLAVDLSNIAGSSLKELLEVAGGDAIRNTPPPSAATIAFSILSGTLTVGVTILAGVAIGLPGLLMFLLTILITLLILIGRQAGVVLLVVVSPLAFASWILPNTEQWFKKWQKMLLGLLLVYPAVALLFGAGKFAAKVLSASGRADGFMQIAALIVSALPLIMTPSLLRKSMDALGSISSVAERFNKRASEKISNSGYVKHREKLQARKRAQIQSGTYEGKGGRLNPSNWRTGINRWRNRNSTFNAITGGYGDKLNVLGASVAAAQDKEEMEAAEASISALGPIGNDAMLNMIKTGQHNGRNLTEQQRRAAIRLLAPKLSGKEADQLATMTSDASWTYSMRKEAAAAVRGAGDKAPWLKGKSLADIESGGYSSEASMTSYLTKSIKAGDIPAMDADSLQRLREHAGVEAKAGNSRLLDSLNATKQEYMDSQALLGSITPAHRAELEQISSSDNPAPVVKPTSSTSGKSVPPSQSSNSGPGPSYQNGNQGSPGSP